MRTTPKQPPPLPDDDYGKDKYAMKTFQNKAFQDFKKEQQKENKEQLKMLEEDPFEQEREKHKRENRITYQKESNQLLNKSKNKNWGTSKKGISKNRNGICQSWSQRTIKRKAC